MLNNIILKYYTFKNILLFKLNKKIDFSSRLRIRGPIKLDVINNANLKIGSNFNLTSGLMQNPLGRNLKSMIRIEKGANITIGNNVGMSCVTLWSKKSIHIGDNVKLGSGVDLVNINHRRIEADQINIREPAETFVYNAPPQKNNCGLTRVKSKLPENTNRERINPDILNAFKENPYTQSLTSSVY